MELSESEQLHVTVSYNPEHFAKGKKVLRFYRNSWAADRVDFTLYTGERIFIHKAGYYAEVEESSAGNTFVEVLRQSIIAREG